MIIDKKILKTIQRYGSIQEITIDHIITIVCDILRMPESNMFERLRNRKTHSEPRQIIMYLADKHTFFKHDLIANHLNLDRTTVLHGIKSIKTFLEYDTDMINIVKNAETKINYIKKNS